MLRRRAEAAPATPASASHEDEAFSFPVTPPSEPAAPGAVFSSWASFQSGGLPRKGGASSGYDTDDDLSGRSSGCLSPQPSSDAPAGGGEERRVQRTLIGAIRDLEAAPARAAPAAAPGCGSGSGSGAAPAPAPAAESSPSGDGRPAPGPPSAAAAAPPAMPASIRLLPLREQGAGEPGHAQAASATASDAATSDQASTPSVPERADAAPGAVGSAAGDMGGAGHGEPSASSGPSEAPPAQRERPGPVPQPPSLPPTALLLGGGGGGGGSGGCDAPLPLPTTPVCGGPTAAERPAAAELPAMQARPGAAGALSVCVPSTTPACLV
jgi:hypothetical protein